MASSVYTTRRYYLYLSLSFHLPPFVFRLNSFASSSSSVNSFHTFSSLCVSPGKFFLYIFLSLYPPSPISPLHHPILLSSPSSGHAPSPSPSSLLPPTSDAPSSTSFHLPLQTSTHFPLLPPSSSFLSPSLLHL